MNATDAEYSIYEESELDEAELDFSASIRPQFKDANDFGRACRLLAIPVKIREEFATI